MIPDGPPPLPGSGGGGRGDGTTGGRGSSAGAWAAAAVVLALGALVFGVLAHIRITDLENRVAALEADAPAGGGAPETSTVASIGSLPELEPADVGPVDPDGARVDIADAFGVVYSSANGVEGRLGRIDDPTGVADAIRQVERGANAPAVNSASVNVSDVTFTSETRARVVYTVAIAGQPAAVGRVGEARVSGGAWKVTRATICGDLAAVGGNCG